MAYRHGEPVGIHHVSLPFRSVDVGSGINYAGGWYLHESGSDDFLAPVTFGSANAAYGGHVYLVAAAGVGGGNTTVQISGTSWAPGTGVRDGTPDTEDIVLSDAGALGAFYQTSLEWIGQPTIAKTGGPDLLCNYGLASYWHHGFGDYVLDSFYVSWQGDATDANADVIFYHHDPSAVWTYAAGGVAIPPILYDMQTDYGAEHRVLNFEPGSYQRYGLNNLIETSAEAGLIVALVQSGNRPYGIGSVLLGIHHP